MVTGFFTPTDMHTDNTGRPEGIGSGGMLI